MNGIVETLTAEEQECRAQMIRQILADIARDFPDLCSHCGRRISGDAVTTYVDDTLRMPCSPPCSDTCHQPLDSPDRDPRKRHLPPAMLSACAGWFRFYRELDDGREIYRCRHCGDLLILTPVFSKAGMAWLRDQYLTERAESVGRFMGSHVSMYAGKRARRPARWALRAD